MQMPHRAHCSVVLGHPVNEADLYEVAEYSAHAKCESQGPGPYCSSCGIHLSQTNIRNVPRQQYVPKDHTYFGIPIRQFSVDGYRSQSIWTFEQYSVSGGVDNRIKRVHLLNFGTSVEVENFKRTCKNHLEPIGLWNPEAWGIWVAFDFA